MKRLICLILMITILTGCSATARFDVDKNTVKESFTAVASNDSEYKEMKNWPGFPLPIFYDQELENPFGNEKQNGVSYYNASFDDTNKKVTIDSSFSLKEHSRSSLVRGCFKHYNVVKNDDVTIFSTSNGLICSFTNFNIVVSTPYLVVKSNASSVDSTNNVYTWKVNNSNKNNVSVYMEIDFSRKFNQQDDNSDENAKTTNKRVSNVLVIGIFVAIVVGTIFTIIVLNTRKNKLSKL